MPLLAVLDESAHTALDDSLKTFYVQNTETKEYHLDIAPDEAAKLAHHQRTQLEAKKADLSRVHGEKTAIEQKYKAFEKLGKSPDEIEAALEGKQPKEVAALVSEHRAELDRVTKSFEQPLREATEKVTKYQAQIQESVARSEIRRLRQEFDLNETADYVLRDYVKAVPKDDDSEEYVPRIFENGQPMLVANAPVSSDDFIKRLQADKKFPAMFNAQGGGGAGSNPRHGGNPAGVDFSKLSPTEKLKLGHRK